MNMKKTFSILPVEEIRIIKRVVIVSDNAVNRDISIGYFLYERLLSSEYRFIEKKEEEKDFDYYLTYPKQEDFPKDKIDELILQAIQNNYPKSFTISYSLISSLDKENIELFKNRPSEKSSIIFSPDLSNLDYSKFAGKDINYMKIDMNVFVDFKLEYIKNLFFYGKYDLSKENEIFNSLDKIKFI